MIHDTARRKPLVKIKDARIWRDNGTRIAGVEPLGVIYGTARDWVMGPSPVELQVSVYSNAARNSQTSDAKFAWLNFEHASAYIGQWNFHDWEVWSSHLRAEFMRQHGEAFNGCILYDASPDRDEWHTRQWDNTVAIRIPNLVCGSAYKSNRWQAERFESLRRSRMNGYDIAVFVGIEDQDTHRFCTKREWAAQIQFVIELLDMDQDTDQQLGTVEIVYFDNPFGHPNRAPVKMWAEYHAITLRLVELDVWRPPATDADTAGCEVTS